VAQEGGEERYWDLLLGKILFSRGKDTGRLTGHALRLEMLAQEKRNNNKMIKIYIMLEEKNLR